MPAKLTVTKQSDHDWRFEAEFDQDTIKIGRHHSNDLHLEDPQKVISRYHAELRREGETYFLVDCESANSTFLNEEKLRANEPCALQDGDRIKIGEYALSYTNIPVSSDATMVFQNPFLEEVEQFKEIVQKIQSKYARENPGTRKEALRQSLQKAAQEFGEGEISEILAEVFSAGVNNAAVPEAAEEIPRVQVSATASASRVDAALDIFMDATIQIVQEARKFRSEFVEIATVEYKHSLHLTTIEKLKAYLFSETVSDEEARNRLKGIKNQIDELLIHQSALADGYRAAMREGPHKLLQGINPVNIEKHHHKEVFQLGPVKVPRRVIPLYTRMAAYQTLKRIIGEMLNESPASFDRKIFRPAFVQAYMEKISSIQKEFSDSRQF